MKKTCSNLKALIVVIVLIAILALPGIASADDAKITNNNDYQYVLGVEELGAGATPLTGQISIPEYRARQAMVQSSPMSLDLDLSPIKVRLFPCQCGKQPNLF